MANQPRHKSKKLELRIWSGTNSVNLEWPIATPAKGPCRVQLPGGEVKIWPRALRTLPSSVPSTAIDTFISQVRLAVIEAASDDVVVPVERKGKGPTEKSAKYQVAVQYHSRYVDPHLEPRRYAHAMKHTLTLATSLVREIKIESTSGTYIPAWAIFSTLKNRELMRNGERASFPGAIWLGEQALRTQLDGALSQLAKMDAESEERRRRAQEEKAKREQLLQEQLERVAREDEARRERTAKKKRPVRVPDRRVENCRVEWFRRDGNFQKQEHAAEPCVVEHYGKKIVIHTPDGQKISKLQGPNLKIMPRTVESPTPEQLG